MWNINKFICLCVAVCFLSSQFPVREMHSLLSPALLVPTTNNLSKHDLIVRKDLNIVINEKNSLRKRASWQTVFQYIQIEHASLSFSTISQFIEKCPYPEMVTEIKKYPAPNYSSQLQKLRLRMILFRITHGYYFKFNSVISALETFPSFLNIRKIYEKNKNKFQNDMIALLYAVGEIDRGLAITHLKNIAKRKPTKKNIPMIQETINALELLGVQHNRSLLYYAQKGLKRSLQIWFWKNIGPYHDFDERANYNLMLLNDPDSINSFLNTLPPINKDFLSSARISLLTKEYAAYIYNLLLTTKCVNIQMDLRNVLKNLGSNKNIAQKISYRFFCEIIRKDLSAFLNFCGGFIAVIGTMSVIAGGGLLLIFLLLSVPEFILTKFIGINNTNLLESVLITLYLFFSIVYIARKHIERREEYLSFKKISTDANSEHSFLEDFYGDNDSKINSAIQKIKLSKNLPELMPIFLEDILQGNNVNRTTRLLITIESSRPSLIYNASKSKKFQKIQQILSKIENKKTADLRERLVDPDKHFRRFILNILSQRTKLWKIITDLLDNTPKNQEEMLQLLSTHSDNHLAIPFLMAELHDASILKAEEQVILPILIAIGKKALPSLVKLVPTTNDKKLHHIQLQRLKNKLNHPAVYITYRRTELVFDGLTNDYEESYREVTVEDLEPTLVRGFSDIERAQAARELGDSGMKEAYDILQERLKIEKSISNTIEKEIFKIAINDAIRTIQEKSLMPDISSSSLKHIHKAA